MSPPSCIFWFVGCALGHTRRVLRALAGVLDCCVVRRGCTCVFVGLWLNGTYVFGRWFCWLYCVCQRIVSRTLQLVRHLQVDVGVGCRSEPPRPALRSHAPSHLTRQHCRCLLSPVQRPCFLLVHVNSSFVNFDVVVRGQHVHVRWCRAILRFMVN